MLCLYPKKYFCFQLVFYQYILRENLQLAPDAVPVDKQHLLNLVLVEPWGASFTCGSEAGKSGCSLSRDGDHQQLSTYFSMKKSSVYLLSESSAVLEGGCCVSPWRAGELARLLSANPSQLPSASQPLLWHSVGLSPCSLYLF